MTSYQQDPLKQQAGRAILTHAIFRVESALTIALTILLAFFFPEPLPWWRWWYWVVLGLLAEALIIYTSVTDERTGQQVVADMLREHYHPKAIKTPRYRKKLEQALEYERQIKRVIDAVPAGVLRDHLHDSTTGIADWIDSIYTVAQKLDAYERDELLQRDAKELPESVQRLNRALAAERDAVVRKQIQATIAAKKAQQDNLEALENQMQQAEFRLEETLTSLGTVYSQFQLIQAQKMGSAGARSLSADIHRQVQGLQDIITSMNEVYGQAS